MENWKQGIRRKSGKTGWNLLALTWLVRCAPCDGSPRAAPSSSANPLFLLQQQKRQKSLRKEIESKGERDEKEASRGDAEALVAARRPPSPGLSRTVRMWRPPIGIHTHNIYVAGERGYHWLCAVLTWTTGLVSRSSPFIHFGNS